MIEANDLDVRTHQIVRSKKTRLYRFSAKTSSKQLEKCGRQDLIPGDSVIALAAPTRSLKLTCSFTRHRQPSCLLRQTGYDEKSNFCDFSVCTSDTKVETLGTAFADELILVTVVRHFVGWRDECKGT